MDLLYFRDLIEGRDAVSWTSWWSQNEGRLRMRLPRAEFLRLKFHSLEHAATVLTTAGIEYSWSRLGRARHIVSSFDPRFIDGAGLPTSEWFRNLGALAEAVEQGEPSAIRHAAQEEVVRVRRLQAPGEQPLGELVFHADTLYELGSHLAAPHFLTAGIALLEAIAEVDSDDDLDELPAVHDARAALTRLSAQPSATPPDSGT
jgi:hypothetical protein